MYLQPSIAQHEPQYHRTGGLPEIARTGRLDALMALDRIGTRLRYARNQEIYAEGDRSGSWYKVLSGTVRLGKLLPDGRRQIAEFCQSGDAFGLDDGAERMLSAEAVDDAVVVRYPRSATERLIDDDPALGRGLCEMTLRSLAAAQRRMLVLGRMTAVERVATFLLDLAEREDADIVAVPMSRSDIADHLGLTIETVCRVLSDLRRRSIVGVQAHAIELIDREALEAIAEE